MGCAKMPQTIPAYRSILVLSFVAVFLSTAGTNDLHAAKSNVILVMADDLGIGDVSPTNPDCKKSKRLTFKRWLMKG
jgi:hypothetical protein